MADLPSGPIVKINDLETAQDSPLTQALMVKIGQNLNALIDRTFFYQEFLTSSTFQVPTAIERLWIYGCGGGGGGTSGRVYPTAPSGTTDAGGAGGAGANPTWHLVDVTPGVTYAVTIGAGGAGGGNSNNNGSDGGTTSFGSLAYFTGGEAGLWVPIWAGQTATTNGVNYEPRPGSNAGSCTASRGGRGAWVSGLGPANIPGIAAARGIIGSAGALGSGVSGGGGGGGSIGNGGDGAGTGNSPVATAGGIGAGGGAGCGGSVDVPGAPGGPGYMMIVWF